MVKSRRNLSKAELLEILENSESESSDVELSENPEEFKNPEESENSESEPEIIEFIDPIKAANDRRTELYIVFKIAIFLRISEIFDAVF